MNPEAEALFSSEVAVEVEAIQKFTASTSLLIYLDSHLHHYTLIVTYASTKVTTDVL